MIFCWFEESATGVFPLASSHATFKGVEASKENIALMLSRIELKGSVTYKSTCVQVFFSQCSSAISTTVD